jgi:hypothetical protein
MSGILHAAGPMASYVRGTSRIGILAAISLLITWLASYLVRLLTDRNRLQDQSGASKTDSPQRAQRTENKEEGSR